MNSLDSNNEESQRLTRVDFWESDVAPAMNMEQYQAANRALEDFLSKIHTGNFRVHPVAAFFCRPDCQLADASWKPLYFDNSHLTLTGGELLRPLFATIVSNAL